MYYIFSVITFQILHQCKTILLGRLTSIIIISFALVVAPLTTTFHVEKTTPPTLKFHAMFFEIMMRNTL